MAGPFPVVNIRLGNGTNPIHHMYVWDMYVWVCMGFSSVIYVIQLSNSLLFRDLDDIFSPVNKMDFITHHSPYGSHPTLPYTTTRLPMMHYLPPLDPLRFSPLNLSLTVIALYPLRLPHAYYRIVMIALLPTILFSIEKAVQSKRKECCLTPACLTW